MKAIIQGRRYDTEKATLVGWARSGGLNPFTDLGYWEAGLYKSPRAGNFFLAGKGGSMTRWVSNGRTGGSGIIPLDRDEALKWAERYLSQGVIEKHFADVIEDA